MRSGAYVHTTAVHVSRVKRALVKLKLDPRSQLINYNLGALQTRHGLAEHFVRER